MDETYPRITKRFRAAVLKVLESVNGENTAQPDSGLENETITITPDPQNDDLDGNALE